MVNKLEGKHHRWHHGLSDKIQFWIQILRCGFGQVGPGLDKGKGTHHRFRGLGVVLELPQKP